MLYIHTHTHTHMMIFMLQVTQIFKKLYFEESCLLRCDAMFLVKINHFRGTCCLCLLVEK